MMLLWDSSIIIMFLLWEVTVTEGIAVMICPGQWKEIRCEEDKVISIISAAQTYSNQYCDEDDILRVSGRRVNYTEAYQCSHVISCVLNPPACQNSCPFMWYQVSYVCTSSSHMVPSAILRNTDSNAGDQSYFIYVIIFTLGFVITAGVVVSIVLARKIIKVRAELRAQAQDGVGNLRQSLRTLHFWRRVLSRRNNSYIRNTADSPPSSAATQPPGSATEWMTIGEAETIGPHTSPPGSAPLTPSAPPTRGVAT